MAGSMPVSAGYLGSYRDRPPSITRPRTGSRHPGQSDGKKILISRVAESAESEACTMFC
jgi:hypothetical protein